MSRPEVLLRPPEPSTYLDAGFYDRLVAEIRSAADLPPGDADGELNRSVGAFLAHEARLLDHGRFADWAGLFSEACVYWAPSDPAADPRDTVTIFLDDRRRLDDRIARLTSAFAHNQAPRPRLNHQISRVECWPVDGGAGCRVLSSQTIHQYRPGRHACVYVAEVGHVLARTRDGWRIEIKRITLIDHDQALEPSTLL